MWYGLPELFCLNFLPKFENVEKGKKHKVSNANEQNDLYISKYLNTYTALLYDDRLNIQFGTFHMVSGTFNGTRLALLFRIY